MIQTRYTVQQGLFYKLQQVLQSGSLVLAVGTTLLFGGCLGSSTTPREAPPVVHMHKPLEMPKPVTPPLPSVPTPETEELRVLLLLPLSGTHRVVGQDILNAAQMALFDLGNQRIELLVADTGGIPEGVEKALEEATDVEAVSLIIGPLLSPEVEKFAAIKPKHVPALTLTADATWAGPNLYVLGLTPQNQYRALLRYAEQKYLLPLVLLEPQNKLVDAIKHVDTPQSRSVRLLPWPADAEKATQTLTGMRAVILPAGPGAAGTLREEILPYMAPHTRLLGLANWNTPEFLHDKGFDGAWFVGFDQPNWHSFSMRFKELYGHAPNPLAGLGYDAVAVAVSLSLSAKARYPYTPSYLENAEGFKGINGFFRLTASNVADYNLALYEIHEGRARLLDTRSAS